MTTAGLWSGLCLSIQTRRERGTSQEYAEEAAKRNHYHGIQEAFWTHFGTFAQGKNQSLPCVLVKSQRCACRSVSWYYAEDQFVDSNTLEQYSFLRTHATFVPYHTYCIKKIYNKYLNRYTSKYRKINTVLSFLTVKRKTMAMKPG